VTRDEKRPERTVYEITGAGRTITLDWMREMLSRPGKEYPEFPAAISFLALLTPEDALRQLDRRAAAIGAELIRIDASLKEAERVPRLFLLEMEYLRDVQVTELSWVKAVVEELRAGSLTWSEAWIRQVAAEFANQGPGAQPPRE
jgi:hypothetical protein